MNPCRHWLSLLAALLLLPATSLWANPDPPGPATVCVARAEHILVPPGISAPRVLYPEGRVDYDVVERLVDSTIEGLTGKPDREGWRELFSGNERVGIVVDVGKISVQLATVETVIDRLVGAGVQPDNIVVFGGDERDLFNAGFNLNRDGRGVKVMGADSEGFRSRVSRIVQDYCDVLINIATLRMDPAVGMRGSVANLMACVPNVQRVALAADPMRIGSAGGHPAVRLKLRLNFLEAYLPVADFQEGEKVTWHYRGLLVSPDPVAVDTIGLEILEGRRREMQCADSELPVAREYLAAAAGEYRLGQAERARISVKLLGDTNDALVQ